MLSPMVLTKTIPQYTTIYPFSKLPTVLPVADLSSLAASMLSALGTDIPPIRITDSAPLIPCPTPIVEKIERAIIYSTTGISIAVYSPTVPQALSGSTCTTSDGTGAGTSSGTVSRTTTKEPSSTHRVTDTTSTPGGKETTSSTMTSVPRASPSGGHGKKYGTPVVKPRDDVKKSGTSSAGFSVTFLGAIVLLAAIIIS
ncbi:hypothetical protein OCU04_009722 [Sclerotinia nivalis]|uniref:Uncharacterized protein n=1 Tax=Sclerotinia nivalis TaxID=352851 RepID=A0A9X0DHL4_9HELO|nr:hypothetical protein OCU04_009722 [Sclerotinia nivalis]